MKKLIQEMIQVGIIRDNNSSFTSPIVMVKKKYGSWRLCVVYSQLNQHTIKDKFPIPIIEELLDELGEARVFSKLDLGSGYHQIRMYGFYGYVKDRMYLIMLSQPFTDLLKKNGWGWSDQATTAFQALKVALCAAPVPVLSKFQLEFVVDTNASGIGVGAVLQQQGRPIAFFSKALGVRHQTLSIYEKEMLQSYELDDKLKRVIQDVQQSRHPDRKYSLDSRFLRRKGKIMVGRNLQLRQALFHHFHASAVGGHSGVHVTKKRVASLLYWKGLTTDVKHWIRECSVCQKCKGELVASLGLLQPLPILDRAWPVVSLSHPYTAKEVAQEYMNHVYKLHGMPDSIISDRDKIFVSRFWQELFHRAGTKLLLSTAYHPHTDGQTEVLNLCLKNYLRCMIGETPANWSHWSPLVEWWYNSSFYSSIRLTPYEALYGQSPLPHMPFLAEASSVTVVDRSLQAREAARKLLHFHLKRAQTCMKQLADKHRTERIFHVGDLVYLKLQPYRQQSIRKVINQKLSPKYYGPFQVIKKVGEVAYTLQLPSGSRIHPTFHVSQLKKHIGSTPSQDHLPLVDAHGVLQKEPIRIVDRRIVKRGNQAVTEVLVEWVHSFPEDATWEALSLLQTKYPHFHP
ncbi:Retrotransposable element Tf2 [Gossypium australe]|uniref:Retrotransposable element Tf2 n=1 Tax=Gossypium australe TaxID=47621 RepID=A0A5B6W874_9ROSI|nr:Retrotransposable element Tf2 [Gossypium australe]